MAAIKSAAPMNNITTDSIARLAEYRLANGLTFEILAEQMAAAGFPVKFRSLHTALTNRLQTQPRDTTLYKIARFVETLDAAGVMTPAARKPAPRSKRKIA
jgi:hypothetical protein